MTAPPRKVSLGDSIYAAFDGHALTLTIENDYKPSSTITLEPQAVNALMRYVEAIVNEAVINAERQTNEQ